MLRVPLNLNKKRDVSISSCNDESFDPRKLSELVEEQKRVIRKLNLKISKLEESLRKEKKIKRFERVQGSTESSTNLQFDYLKEQISKSNILEDTIDKLAELITDNLTLLIDNISPQATSILPPSLRSLTDIEMTNKFDSATNFNDNETQKKTQIVLKNMMLVTTLIQKQIKQTFELKTENKKMNTQMRKNQNPKQYFSCDIEELKQFKGLYQKERRTCIKLKGLLEKSQFERNNMLTKIQKMPIKLKDQTENKTNEELLSLSKSLNCRINHLEQEKQKIIDNDMKEKQKWNKKYTDFLNKVRTQKDKIKNPEKEKPK